MKNPFGSRSKVIALSLLIMAMILLMYNAISDFKYWIALTITTISLVIINYEHFLVSGKSKKDDNISNS
jgi:hypothetical protein